MRFLISLTCLLYFLGHHVSASKLASPYQVGEFRSSKGFGLLAERIYNHAKISLRLTISSLIRQSICGSKSFSMKSLQIAVILSILTVTVPIRWTSKLTGKEPIP